MISFYFTILVTTIVTLPWMLRLAHNVIKRHMSTQHSLLDSRSLDQLARNGWVSVNVAGHLGNAAALRSEIEQLHGAGLLHPNATHVVQPNTPPLFVDKHAVWEAEGGVLLKHLAQEDIPALFELDSRATRELLPHFSPSGPWGPLTSHAIKIQYNSGGCFPLHTDASRGSDQRGI